MNVLLIGSGGREHALAQVLLASQGLTSLAVAPGNAGTEAHNVVLDVNDNAAVVQYCTSNAIDLVVVGPEQLPSVLRKAGKYASQLRSMSTGLRQEFMAGVDELDPTKWDAERGNGEPDTPIVPKGYAERVAAGEDGNPFKVTPDDAAATANPATATGADTESTDAPEAGVKPVSAGMPTSQPMADPTPEEAVAEATAAAEKAEAEARRAMEHARKMRQEVRAKEAEATAAAEIGTPATSVEASDASEHAE